MNHCDIFHVISVVNCVFLQIVDVKIGILPRNDQIKLVMVEHLKPVFVNNLDETISEGSSLFHQLFVDFEVDERHNELKLILAEDKRTCT